MFDLYFESVIYPSEDDLVKRAAHHTTVLSVACSSGCVLLAALQAVKRAAHLTTVCLSLVVQVV